MLDILKFNPEEPLFTQEKILNVIPELSPGTLQNWVNRKQIEISHKSPGKGKHRLYSFADAVKIAALHFLSFSKRGPAENSKLAELIGNRAVELTREGLLELRSLEAELKQAILVYHFHKDGTLRHNFIAKDEFNIYAMSMDGSWFEADKMITRTWEELRMVFESRGRKRTVYGSIV